MQDALQASIKSASGQLHPSCTPPFDQLSFNHLADRELKSVHRCVGSALFDGPESGNAKKCVHKSLLDVRLGTPGSAASILRGTETASSLELLSVVHATGLKRSGQQLLSCSETRPQQEADGLCLQRLSSQQIAGSKSHAWPEASAAQTLPARPSLSRRQSLASKLVRLSVSAANASSFAAEGCNNDSRLTAARPPANTLLNDILANPKLQRASSAQGSPVTTMSSQQPQDASDAGMLKSRSLRGALKLSVLCKHNKVICPSSTSNSSSCIKSSLLCRWCQRPCIQAKSAKNPQRSCS